MPRTSPALLAVAIAVVASLPADAQEATPHIRGTIESLEGSTLVVNSREGEAVTITLAPDVVVQGVAAASIEDISEDDYVGVASLPNEDGSDGALEVLLFPEAMAGAGAGSFPWDLEPGSTMTNATVSNAVEAVEGSTLTLSYPEGERVVTLPEGIPVVTFAAASIADLVPGETVFVPAEAGTDGTLTTAFVVVGMDGVVPPM